MSKREPSLRLHQPSQQAVVTINGKDHYLRPWGSRRAQVEYERLTGEWSADAGVIKAAERAVTGAECARISEVCGHVLCGLEPGGGTDSPRTPAAGSRTRVPRSDRASDRHAWASGRQTLPRHAASAMGTGATSRALHAAAKLRAARVRRVIGSRDRATFDVPNPLPNLGTCGSRSHRTTFRRRCRPTHEKSCLRPSRSSRRFSTNGARRLA
jgi:hypothetical protein